MRSRRITFDGDGTPIDGLRGMRGYVLATLWVAVLACTPQTSRGQEVLTQDVARQRAAWVRHPSYDLALVLTEGTQTYHARSTARFELTTACTLPVDFRWGTIESYVVNGVAQPIPQAGGRGLAIPSAALVIGANVVTIEYTNPYDKASKGFHRFVDPVDGRTYLHTQFEPYDAHRLFPCFDQPDLRAVLNLEVRAPWDWRIIANAPELGQEPQGMMTRHVFAATRPIAPYLYFVGAGPYASYTDGRASVPTRIFARLSMMRYVDAPAIFETIRQGLDFYARYYGIPYPFPKYDQIYVPEFAAGAMENAGAIAFNERYLYRHAPSTLDRQRHASVILHEMAHQWFGDLVTLKWWDALWLNESFATAMALEALGRATPFTHALEENAASKAGSYREDQLPTTHAIEAAVPDTQSALAGFDGITYGKGAALLRQLAFFMGAEKFREGLHAYLTRHAWGNATADDFFAAMEKACGADLTRWRRLHFRSAGVDRIQVWSGAQSGAGTTAIDPVAIDQEPASGEAVTRPQRLRVAAYPGSADGTLRAPVIAEVAIEGARTPVPALAGSGPYRFVWPNAGEYAYAVVRLDPVSLTFARAHLDRIPDALTRRGVWASLFQMVRDGLLRPTDFADTAIAQLALEPDPDVSRQVLGSVAHIVAHYIAGDSLAVTRRLHALAVDRLRSAQPGSDAQKMWLDTAIDMALDPASQTTLERWLDGGFDAKGIVLDPDRRWRMVIQLACMGRPGIRQRIEAESRSDSSDAGVKRALQAEASIPDAAVKERVWQQCLSDRTSSLSALSARMAGFHHFTQGALARTYVTRYFEALGLVRATRDEEYLDAFAHAMYPAFLHEDLVLEKTRVYLDGHLDLPARVRKFLTQAADEMARAIRIRKTQDALASGTDPAGAGTH